MTKAYKITINGQSIVWEGARKAVIPKAIRHWLKDAELPRDLDGATVSFTVHVDRLK